MKSSYVPYNNAIWEPDTHVTFLNIVATPVAITINDSPAG